MQEKLKTKISPDIIDLAYHIIDWLYFCPRSHYNEIPFFKSDLLKVMNGLRQKKVATKIHKDIEQREHM